MLLHRPATDVQSSSVVFDGRLRGEIKGRSREYQHAAQKTGLPIASETGFNTPPAPWRTRRADRSAQWTISGTSKCVRCPARLIRRPLIMTVSTFAGVADCTIVVSICASG